MVNFLRIENNGLITAEDLKYIGSSTKRGDTTKIGQFGSGWKFALAWILRNDLTIRIFAGLKEVIVDFEVKMHRDNPVRVLTVDGQETSITSGMGEIDWKGWMALREIVSNAIDEGGEDVKTLFNPEIKGVEGKTSIFVEMNGELADILRNFEKYFAFERKPVYQHPGLKIYQGDEKETVVFRKGIRCFERDPIGFDFDFEEIVINESRLSSGLDLATSFKREFRKITDTQIFLELVKRVPTSFLPEMNDNILSVMQQLLSFNKFRPKMSSNLVGMMVPGIIIPDQWYGRLRELDLIPDLFEEIFGKKHQDGNFYILDELTPLSQKVSYELSVAMKMKVVFVKMLDSQVVSVYKNGVFYVSDRCKDKSMPDLFSIIMYACDTLTLQEIYQSFKV